MRVSGQQSDEYEEKRKEQEERTRIAMEFKKIPEKYREIITDKPIEGLIGKNLFLWGKCGRGKTVLGLSVAKESIRKGQSIMYLSFPKFIMDMQSIFRDENKILSVETKKVATFPGILFIDDLGAEKLTEFVRQITYFIINEREQWRLPLIITSNFSLGELCDQIDPRIASRIAGMCTVLEVGGEDRRINKT